MGDAGRSDAVDENACGALRSDRACGSAPAEERSGATPGAARAKSAFERFYTRHFAKLVADLRATYGGGPPEPEDVAQRAFANLGKRGDLQSIDNLEAFVWTVSRNIIYSEKRAQAVRMKNAEDVRSVIFGEGSYDLTPERVFIAKEQLSIVMEALKTMPPRRRRIFILNRAHGFTPAEIARKLGVSRPAVVKHIAKATDAIHAQLEETAHGDAKGGGG